MKKLRQLITSKTLLIYDNFFTLFDIFYIIFTNPPIAQRLIGIDKSLCDFFDRKDLIYKKTTLKLLPVYKITE